MTIVFSATLALSTISLKWSLLSFARCLMIWRKFLKFSRKSCSRCLKKRNQKNIWRSFRSKYPLKHKLIKTNGFKSFTLSSSLDWKRVLNLFKSIWADLMSFFILFKWSLRKYSTKWMKKIKKIQKMCFSWSKRSRITIGKKNS